MTLSDVIDTLQTWIRNADDEYDREEMGRVAGLKEALHEIKKIEPCEDTISRQDAIRWVKTECNPYGKPTLDFESGKKIMKHLEDMSPVQLVSRWIPVSERLPESNGVYIVTKEINDGFECRDLTDACYFDGTTTWYDNHGREYLNKKIKAWMPLPKPYEPQENEEQRSDV